MRPAASVKDMVGLPEAVTACLFDLDGVLTSTAVVHRRAWKRTFDEFLRGADLNAAPFTEQDYATYVDGRPRLDGIRAFLASADQTARRRRTRRHRRRDRTRDREPEEPALLSVITEEGVTPYPGSVRYLTPSGNVVWPSGRHLVANGNECWKYNLSETCSPCRRCRHQT